MQPGCGQERQLAQALPSLAQIGEEVLCELVTRSLWPAEFVLVANLMPREMQATTMNVKLERMSDQQLNAPGSGVRRTERADHSVERT